MIRSYGRTLRTQDFFIAAFVRVAEPARFKIADVDLADLIGYDFPEQGSA